MYPYIKENCNYHLIDDHGIIFTPDGTYILNNVEAYIMEYINGSNSIKDIIEIISNELNIEDKNKIKNIILEFIDSKPKALGIGVDMDKKNYDVIRTGEKDAKTPLNLIISLTNKCNLKCIHCFKDCSSNKRTFINYDNLISVLNYFKGKIRSLQLTGGEPMLHNNFFNILDFSKKNFSTMITTTGTLINEKNIEKFIGANSIQLSLYSHIEKKHDEFTTLAGSYKKTVQALNLINKFNINLVVGTILTKNTLNDIEDFIKFSIDIGIKNLRFGTLSLLGRAESLTNIILDEKDLEKATYDIKNFTEKHEKHISIDDFDKKEIKKGFQENYKCINCGAGIINWCISENGNIKPCEFIPDNVFSMGNINKSPIENIIKDINFLNLPPSMKKWENNLQKRQFSLKDICTEMENYYSIFCEGLK
ncbi:radical SAM protein [Clostridium faecium]|uniref:Radical SAM protein n=1 Tax=Clostridium faecium TaxID=2762223 RepID=A0ABR8YTR6_9CLOT|nr:radical SAM protein [Clostridium faecium]MBD8047654.1 radical SAM protein [Clostridium faecium]